MISTPTDVTSTHTVTPTLYPPPFTLYPPLSTLHLYPPPMTPTDLLALIAQAAAKQWRKLNLSGNDLTQLPPDIIVPSPRLEKA